MVSDRGGPLGQSGECLRKHLLLREPLEGVHMEGVGEQEAGAGSASIIVRPIPVLPFRPVVDETVLVGIVYQRSDNPLGNRE